MRDPDLQAGSYANALAIWHTAHRVSPFDFLVSSEAAAASRPGTEDGEGRDPAPAAPARGPDPDPADGRVRPSSGPINQNLTLYEQRFRADPAPRAPSRPAVPARTKPTDG